MASAPQRLWLSGVLLVLCADTVGCADLPAALISGLTIDGASTFIGATHWNPCYYINSSLPSIWDGAVQLAAMDTRTIKLPFYDPINELPWNSPLWNLTSNFTTLSDLAAHPYYAAVFNNSIPGHTTNFSTYILVAYKWPSDADWCHGNISPAEAAEETRQFSELTLLLMSTYGQSGKRFIFQHWEGDWAARCATYNASQPPTDAAVKGMITWLTARQAGVSEGRRRFCVASLAVRAGIDCDVDDRRILSAAGVEVYNAAEVNLVATSMESGFPNIILTVIPHVSLDMVSYSSYDTMRSTPLFGDALDFIGAHHNATLASPSPPVYVGEYGVAQMLEPVSSLQSVVRNVVAWGASISNVTGHPRAAHVVFWELFDNEARDIPGGRCNPATGPVFNESQLNGFWLVRPDGSKAWAYGYMQGVINGSVPVPTPNATLAI